MIEQSTHSKELKKEVLQKALDLLARREHSLLELRHKLLKRAFPESVIEIVLSEISTHGWQSDERFAESYIYARKQSLYGPERIRQELIERGVSEEVFSEHLQDNDSSWFDLAETLKIKKFGKGVPKEFKEKAKQMRFLQYRGFTASQIKQVFSNSIER